MKVDPALTPYLPVAAASLTAPMAPIEIRSFEDMVRVIDEHPTSQIELLAGAKGGGMKIRPPRRPGEPLICEGDPEIVAAVDALSDQELRELLERGGIDPNSLRRRERRQQ